MDQEKSEAFAGRMLEVMNDASLALMAAIGHKTGLFDSMANLQSSTSEQIASAAGLNERYVREWLGAMVTGRVVEYDSGTQSYALPEEHAAFLTRAAGINNLSAQMLYFPLMGRVIDKVTECFVHGGGVPYSEYDQFQEVMRDDSAQVFEATLIDVTLPFVPGAIDRLKQGIEVADVGCGAGHAINLMAQAFPNSRFTGFDMSEEGISLARQEAESMGLGNAGFEVKDVAKLGVSQRFDLVTTFDAVHDQAYPADVLRNIYEALKPGGDYLCVDIGASSRLEENLEHPIGPMLYTISTMHCMTVSLAYGGAGLGTVWGEQLAVQMMRDAGFKDVQVKKVEGDFFNNYYVAKK